LLDFSKFPVPRGQLEFSINGLVSPRSGLRIEPAVWKGRLVYSGSRSVGVWAKVRVGVTRPRVVAAVDLPAGRPLEASNLKVETVEEYPTGESYLRELEKAVGLTPRRLVRVGEPLRASLLSTPNEVARGDKVDVTVESGGAHLSFAARAETSAGIGGRVLVKNPENGKRFAARVESKGKVVVVAEGDVGVK
jgi:flagella basal body P-ring formation protein FlgA